MRNLFVINDYELFCSDWLLIVLRTPLPNFRAFRSHRLLMFSFHIIAVSSDKY